MSDESIDEIWASMNEKSSIPSKDKKGNDKMKKKKNNFAQATKVIGNFDEIMPKIAKLSITLSDSEGIIRRNSLSSLHNVLFVQYTFNSNVYAKLFREICKPLFKRFSDPLEKCRELAFVITKQLIELSSDVSFILGYFFPALMERIPGGVGYDDSLKVFVSDREIHDAYKRGRAVERQDKINKFDSARLLVAEQSEEIRLLGCEILFTLISKMIIIDCCQMLHAYFEDIVIFLQVQLHDPYPDLKVLACTAIENIAKMTDFEVGMKFYSVALVRVILPLFRHRLSKVRAAAVSALHFCLIVPDREKRKAAGSETIQDMVGFREENTIPVSAFYKLDVQVNYLAEIVSDQCVVVREKLVALLQSLLTDIGDRYDHQTRLLPYLLDLLTDQVESISKAALNCLNKCGELYENEHPDEIIERRQYGIDGNNRVNLEKPLPYPFVSRPRIGVRLYVRGNTSRFLVALVNELTNWVATTRLKSARLLKVIVVLCEEHLTIDVNKLLPSLIKALRFAREDRDIELESVLLDLFELLGRFLLPEIYIFYLLPRLRGEIDVSQSSDSEWKLCVMFLLKGLLSGSKIVEVIPFMDEIVNALCDSFVIPYDSVLLQSNATEIFLTLLHNMTENNGRIVEAFYLATGRLSALYATLQNIFRFALLQLHQESLVENASKLLIYLSRVENGMNTEENLERLFKKYFASIINYCIESYMSDFSDAKCNISHLLFSRIAECPYLHNICSFEQFHKIVCCLCENMENVAVGLKDKDMEIKRSIWLSELMLKIISSLSISNKCSVHLRYYDILYDKRTFENSAGCMKKWNTTVEEHLEMIFQHFIYKQVWNNELLHHQIKLLKILLSKVENNFVYISPTTLLDIFPKLSSTLLSRALLQQSTPSSVKLEVLILFSDIIESISIWSGLDKIVGFKFWKRGNTDIDDIQLYILKKHSIQDVLNIFLHALNDSDDDVRKCAIESLISAFPFVMNKNETEHERNVLKLSDNYTRSTVDVIVDTLLKLLLVEGCNAACDNNYQDLPFLDYLDQALRSICVLDPQLFEAAIENQISQLSIDDDCAVISYLNEFIDHADIVKRLSFNV